MGKKIVIKVKRIYQKPEKRDDLRILVDRLWPRGVSKEKAKVDLWLKEIALSDNLREWFSHDPKKWEEFKNRYKEEFRGTPALIQLKNLIKKRKTVTLLFAARDEKHNNAQALKEFLSP